MSLLSVRNVTLRFGGITALQDVSFDVEEGTTVGLIGPNGAGKTTMFNVITRLYRLDEGDVLADGKSLLRTPPSRIIRHGIARTFQNAQPFATMTVLENVLVGAHAGSRFERERSVRRRALEALDLIDVAQFADQPAAALPFGTLKRIELARALVSRPRLLLLDEPAGGLNHLEVESLAELLQRIRSELKVTLLLVEHHMGLVMKLSDHVNVLNFGAPIASGPPEEIQRNPEVIEAYLGGGARRAVRPDTVAPLLELRRGHRQLRAGQGPARHLAAGRRGRDRRGAGRQRRREDDDAARDLPHRADGRRDPLRGPLDRRARRREHGLARDRARPGGTRPVPGADDRREPAPGRLHPPRLRQDRPRPRLRVLPLDGHAAGTSWRAR